MQDVFESRKYIYIVPIKNIWGCTNRKNSGLYVLYLRKKSKNVLYLRTYWGRYNWFVETRNVQNFWVESGVKAA